MFSFIYDIPTKVYFGQGHLSKLGEELARFGTRVLLVYGGGSIKRSGLYDTVAREAAAAGLELHELSGIAPNPRIGSVRRGASLCKELGIDVVLAVGGGSVIDAAKFIAAGACADHDPWDFLDRSKLAPVKKALPRVTVLTLSATGSEMDECAVISNPETNEKFGGHSPLLYPKVSFLDPTLTYSVGTYQTASGSADILNHILETYFNLKPEMYMIEAVMEGLLKAVMRAAPIALREPENYEARAELMWTSSWAINGFILGSRKRAWSCHPMEHELSAFYDVTHGHGLAILTPRWMEYCLNERTCGQYVKLGVNVLGIDASLPPMEIAHRAIEEMRRFLFEELGLSSTLSSIGIGEENLAAMARKACGAKGCIEGFMPLTPADVESIYRMCL